MNRTYVCHYDDDVSVSIVSEIDDFDDVEILFFYQYYQNVIEIVVGFDGEDKKHERRHYLLKTYHDDD